MKFSSI